MWILSFNECIILFLVLEGYQALNLNIPTDLNDILASGILNITWTTDSVGDPAEFRLELICSSGFNGGPVGVVASVQAGNGQVVMDGINIKLPVTSGPVLESCALHALDLNITGDNIIASSQPFVILDGIPSQSGITPTSTLTSSLPPVTSSTEPTTPVSTRHHKSIIGPAVGGAIGGLGLFAALVVLVILRRRRSSSSNNLVVVPLAHEPGYTQPLDKRARLEELNRGRMEAERQRDMIQAEIQDSLSSSSDHDLSNSRDVDGQIRQQMELLNSRIDELAAQLRELDVYASRPLEDTPPDYSASANRVV